jgi:predicted dehydrogenase
MIRIGIIGLGEVGEHHARSIKELPNAVLSAVCDTDINKLKKISDQLHCKPFNSSKDLLSTELIDAVIICVPHNLHCNLVLEALENNKHVLIEKPMAVTVSECDRMINKAKEKSKLLLVSHNQVFYEPFKKIYSMIQNKEIKKPHLFRARLSIGGKFGQWRSSPQATGGGILFDAGVHRFYLANFLMGNVKTVSSILDTEKPKINGENSAAIILKFESGAIGIIDANYFAPKGVFDDMIEIISEDAMIKVPGCEAHFENFSKESDISIYQNGSWKNLNTPADNWIGTIKKSDDHFIKCILKEEIPLISGEIGKKTVELIELAYKNQVK